MRNVKKRRCVSARGWHGGEREDRGRRLASDAPDRLDDARVELAALPHHPPEELIVTVPISVGTRSPPPHPRERARVSPPRARIRASLTSRPSMDNVSGSFGHAAGHVTEQAGQLRATFTG